MFRLLSFLHGPFTSMQSQMKQDKSNTIQTPNRNHNASDTQIFIYTYADSIYKDYTFLFLLLTSQI